MSEPIKHGYVNWIDGMKMSKGHFLELQQAIEDRLRDARGASAYQHDFGIVPGRFNGKTPLDYSITFDSRSKFTIRLSQCRGITAAGDRIEILDGLHAIEPALTLSAEVGQALMQEGNEFDILVRIDSANMEAYGVANVEERPERLPFAQPKCLLELAPVKDLREEAYARNYLVVARLRVTKDELVHDAEYIPACTSMESLPRLESFHTEYYKFLKETEQNFFKIVIRLNKREVKTELSDAVDIFCRAGIQFLERELSAYQVLGRRQSPRHLVVHAMGFARAMRYAIELQTGQGKDGLLNYIKEVIAVSPADYLQHLGRLTDLEYEHTNLKDALTRILDFCRTNRKLLDEWVRLDYIGEKKNKDIFIHEERPTVQPPVKRNWDFGS